MRTLLTGTLAATALTFAVSFSVPVLADSPDPGVHQIYEAAEAGHFDQAQQMMDQVLRDHPKSAKAHYVQAELYAREGKSALARTELSTAESFDPGLSHESPRAVQDLKAQLGLTAHSADGPRVLGMTEAPRVRFPWGTVVILALVIGALWMVFRRRTAYGQYPAQGGVVGGPGYAGPAGYGGGYGPGPMGGGGIGSGMAGGLASGLAVGAGVVAGEELAHHFLDGRHDSTVVPPSADSDWQEPGNADMGGNDFGVNDAGSWDDSGGGGGGGGGDDWS